MPYQDGLLGLKTAKGIKKAIEGRIAASSVVWFDESTQKPDITWPTVLGGVAYARYYDNGGDLDPNL